MTKIPIKIKFQNGINYSIAINEILNELLDEYHFIESEEPDFILFGPYGNDIPKKGNYCRIGYFCENITPDLSVCEWAFGVPREEEIGSSRYKRIQWHGLNPTVLIKNIPDNEIEGIKAQKSKFCNFLYSHPVSYREEFFKQLSKYKKVDAPGKSMNNMPSIDQIYKGDIWERKRIFLSEYKFTIAFENYSYPGYQTEKLYDSMQSLSIPVYCGDPNINEVFNAKSFINATDYIKPNQNSLITFLESSGQPNFEDIRPMFYKSIKHRIRRKLKALARNHKMKLQYKHLDFGPLINKIIEIDQNDYLYTNMLREPWFQNNTPPVHLTTYNRWKQIFSEKHYN